MSNLKPILINLECYIDDRGFLYQIYGQYKDVFPELKRVYVVGNFSKGIIRGFHKHLYEWKGYFVVLGSAKFVTIDENKNIGTYILSIRKPAVLIVPPNYYHGWVSLEDNTILIGLSNKSLEESLSDDIRIDPFAFGKEIWETKPR